jgi:lipid-binding SYLF domain-containing protein
MLRSRLMAGALVVMTGLAVAGAAHAEVKLERDAVLDKQVMATLQQCQTISSSCANNTKGAAGVLVFPSVVKASFLIGGAGGKGALVENGEITGYYSIGAGTVGLQAGIENASQVYAFQDDKILTQLKNGSDWRVGATADVTLVTADAATKQTSGDVMAYVFDAKGLHGGIAFDLFDVWKTGDARPQFEKVGQK